MKITRRQLRNLIREEVALISEDTGDTGDPDECGYRVSWIARETGKEHWLPSEGQECFSEKESEDIAAVLRGELGDFSMVPHMMPRPDSVELIACERGELGALCYSPPLMT